MPSRSPLSEPTAFSARVFNAGSLSAPAPPGRPRTPLTPPSFSHSTSLWSQRMTVPTASSSCMMMQLVGQHPSAMPLFANRPVSVERMQSACLQSRPSPRSARMRSPERLRGSPYQLGVMPPTGQMHSPERMQGLQLQTSLQPRILSPERIRSLPMVSPRGGPPGSVSAPAAAPIMGMPSGVVVYPGKDRPGSTSVPATGPPPDQAGCWQLASPSMHTALRMASAEPIAWT